MKLFTLLHTLLFHAQFQYISVIYLYYYNKPCRALQHFFLNLGPKYGGGGGWITDMLSPTMSNHEGVTGLYNECHVSMLEMLRY